MVQYCLQTSERRISGRYQGFVKTLAIVKMTAAGIRTSSQRIERCKVCEKMVIKNDHGEPRTGEIIH